MNTVSVIGTGYVGLVTGTCLSELGSQVICMDIDESKIEDLKNGKIPIYEPGLDILIRKNYASGRLRFTTSIEEAVDNSTAIFIAVGTPSNEDGSADLEHVLGAASSIAEHMNDYKVIINKSTVPVGTGQLVNRIIRKVLVDRGVEIAFDMVSNPEFLKEGSAVGDFMHPDRIVIGYESERSKEVMESIYYLLQFMGVPIVFTSIETAELIKYASNAFLATKISFINEIANLCEAVDADIQDVVKAMVMDVRIGKHYLRPGPGFGGSCFPKDTRALEKIGEHYNIDMELVKTVIKVNESQKKLMAEKIKRKMADLKDATIAVLGLAFKPETDDIREAPSLTIIKELISNGAKIKVYDPAAMENVKKLSFKVKNNEDKDFSKTDRIFYCQDEYEAVTDADAVVIATEWKQFANLDLRRVKDLMSGNHFFDFRNLFSKKELQELGFDYECVGKGTKNK